MDLHFFTFTFFKHLFIKDVFPFLLTWLYQLWQGILECKNLLGEIKLVYSVGSWCFELKYKMRIISFRSLEIS